MKKSRFIETQVVSIINQHEYGVKTFEICIKNRIDEQISSTPIETNLQGVILLAFNGTGMSDYNGVNITGIVGPTNPIYTPLATRI
jgi:hypothetical protein